MKIKSCSEVAVFSNLKINQEFLPWECILHYKPLRLSSFQHHAAHIRLSLTVKQWSRGTSSLTRRLFLLVDSSVSHFHCFHLSSIRIPDAAGKTGRASHWTWCWSSIPLRSTGGPTCHSFSPSRQHPVCGPLRTDCHLSVFHGAFTNAWKVSFSSETFLLPDPTSCLIFMPQESSSLLWKVFFWLLHAEEDAAPLSHTAPCIDIFYATDVKSPLMWLSFRQDNGLFAGNFCVLIIGAEIYTMCLLNTCQRNYWVSK